MILLHLVAGPRPARIGPGPEGFVHLCTPAQAAGVVARFFPGGASEVAIDADRLDPALLRWEDSYGHGLFPHYYGEIPAAAILAQREGPSGR